MDIIIKEIKAYCKTPELIESYLIDQNADYKGIDFQADTYFKVKNGRLKLRIGSTERNLIWYQRSEVKGMKHSEVRLFPVNENAQDLSNTLSGGLEILVKVKKERKIFFIDNLKFHIDRVENLGSFIEIEAIGKRGDVEEKELERQCQFYIDEFKLRKKDMIAQSYSDMIMDKKKEVRSNQRTS